MKKLIFRKFIKDISFFFVLMCLTLGLIVWTLQAVNYLDFVTQDGHGLKTYFLYTIFNFPKIIHRIIPFIFLISLFFIITNYESRNELLIFWLNGITKIKFANKIIFCSIFLLILQIFIGSFISPKAQFKARTFLKNSDINYFSALIQAGKFINVVEGLTIFIESKNNKNIFNNIFIDDSSKGNTKMIYAENGKIINKKNQKVFKLYKGKVINQDKFKVNIFEFDQIDFNLSNYSTNTILAPKIQETSSMKLFLCFLKISLKKNVELKNNDFKCEPSIVEEMKQELLKRFYKPFYIPIIALICCFLIVQSKDNLKYGLNKNIIFLFGFFALLISETSLRYAVTSNKALLFYILLPWLIFILIYLKFYNKVKNV
jgi:lipopolysaccharide export system permease protein